TIVTLDGDKIRKAQPNDTPIGVISGTAALVANEKTFHHKDRFLKNEYGVTITNRKQVEFVDDEGNVSFEWRDIPVENPEYNDKIDYQSRSERPEWNVVGLLGQIYTNIEKDVIPGDYINGRAGVGYKDNVNGKGRVMKITSEYTEERGCAI
ncbi:peptidase G2 autoproteolytic cleavage domain-containing protein, partial [Staphylococcus aureus]